MLCTIISKPLSKSKYGDETVATSNLMIQNMKILWIRTEMFRSGHILQHETPIAKKKKGQMYIIRPVTSCLKIEHFR